MFDARPLERPADAPTHLPVTPSALDMATTPLSARKVAKALWWLVPALFAALLLVPWQQSAVGEGRVIAYAPAERQQAVDAPMSGRIERWYVQEGQQVSAGDPLVALRDNDAELLERLTGARDAEVQGRESIANQVRSYDDKIVSARSARDLVVAEYDAKIASLERKLTGVAAEVRAEDLQADRMETLAAEGIVSNRSSELALVMRDKARAAYTAMEREIQATERAKRKARAEAEAKMASAQAERESAQAKLRSQEQKVAQAEIKVERQRAQLVRAPRDGVVLRLHGGPGGSQVKAGEALVSLVPDAAARAVELWIDGNDMPLVTEGEEVRLLFEGWPALQMVGFPGSGSGTYGGKVAFVDATDDGKGAFRVVVQPNPSEPAWPEAVRLRQGVRTRGFILLGQVSLGYELWRRVHGFPALPPREKGNAISLPSGKKPRSPGGLK